MKLYCLATPIAFPTHVTTRFPWLSQYHGFFDSCYFSEKSFDISVLLEIKSKTDYLIQVTQVPNFKTLDEQANSKFKLIGYDVGLLKDGEEFVFYSFIPNELTLTCYDEKTPFLHSLNKHGLFSSHIDAFRFIDRRAFWLSVGKSLSLETFYDDCSQLNVYAIHEYLI